MAPDKDSFEGMAPGPVGDDLGIDQTKAKLDDSELSDDLPKSLQKVDLDLDDAPFLEDEEEEEPEPIVEASGEESEEEAPVPWWKKKQIVFPGAGLLLLLLGVSAYFLFFSAEETPPPPAEIVEEQPLEEPAPPPPPAPETITVAMDPFLVEETDAKGQTRFLSVTFSTTTTNPETEKEIKGNIVVLRDAIYYYLKNKSLIFLTDKKNGDALKQDILSVINQFLSSEQLDNLLIEDYLVK